MKLTVITITVMAAIIVVSQVYAWTRNNDKDFGFSERQITVFAFTMVDIAIVFLLGGLFLW